MTISRRSLLKSFLASATLLPLHKSFGLSGGMAKLPLTPTCPDKVETTLPRQAGPFYKRQSPLKHNLVDDTMGGERITVAGFVLNEDCKPQPDCRVEIWHADDNGHYDSQGFRLRGHCITDERGRWWFDTIIPGLYPGRTRHYHFKVHTSTGHNITTQLFFPGEQQNKTDYIFNEALLMEINEEGNERLARFDFVV